MFCARYKIVVYIMVCQVFISMIIMYVNLNSRWKVKIRRHRKHRRVRVKPPVDDGFDHQNSDLHLANQGIDLSFNEANLSDNDTFEYDNMGESSSMSLLTLFTTMKGTNSRNVIHRNTLENWAALKPYITPVLFVENNTRPQWRNFALALGWDIKNVTRTNFGIPTLRHMFIQVQREYNTPFYGFANADILFDKTLIESMKAFDKHRNYTKHLFCIGKRTNLDVSRHEFKNMTVSIPSTVSKLSKKYGVLFESYAQDYFITNRHGFPWQKIPDLVVGRAGYDNWLVIKAQEWKLTAVDASYTINAVHQTGLDGNRAGWSVQKNRCINRDIIGRFSYTKGRTKCVPYISYKDITGDIKIFHRPAISRECYPGHSSPHKGCV